MKKLSVIVICSILASCQMMVEIDVPHDPPKIVVNSIFSPDSAWFVSIFRTRYVLDDNYDYLIEGAAVSLHDENGQEIIMTEQPLGSGNINFAGRHFLSNSKPVPGVNYELRVTASGYTPAVASAKVPERVEILNAVLDSANMVVDQNQFTTIPLDITISDPAGNGDFYYPQLFMTVEYQDKDPNTGEIKTYEALRMLELRRARANDDQIINVDDDRNVTVDDLAFDGKVHTIRLFVWGYPGIGMKSLKLRLHHAGREYSRYFISERLQNETEGNPFAQPVQVYSNVEGGLGIFAGYSTSSWEFVK